MVVTKGDDDLIKPQLLDIAALAPSKHEKADSHIMLHAVLAASNEH